MSLDLPSIDRTIAHARDCGTLLEIETEHEWLTEGDFRFLVRWISSLSSKDARRIKLAGEKTQGSNPFLPPDPSLLVGVIGESHKLVLNKFPVIERHLLLVTSQFEDQTSPLTHQDFSVLAKTLNCLGGLVFYNGGAVAGASQPHKHLQWVPVEHDMFGLRGFTKAINDAPALTAVRHPGLPWRHAFVRHKLNNCVSHDLLSDAFTLACKHVDLSPNCNPMSPYNLLVDLDWLLVVPRSHECHEGISVNSLGYAGSLFVRRPDQIALVKSLGPLKLLAKTAC